MSVLALLALAELVTAPASLSGPFTTAESRPVDALVSEYVRERGGTVASVAPIPSFSRQTGFACNLCHTSFPQLSAFGRDFKLNGYTLTVQQTVQVQDSGRAPSLRVNLIPPISAMLVSSLTSVRRDVPGAQNGTVAFPQELGLFIGGAITPKVGTFLQLTYDPASGGIGLDNAEVRFAQQASLGGKSLLFGFTVNNSPTVQDVWNSTPVWGFPYSSSAVAPTPVASTLIDGGLAQAAMGVGTYTWWNNLLYAEFSLYRSAFKGGPFPVDTTATNAIHGVAPYWRVALQRQLGGASWMVGAFGMLSHVTPSGFEGARDRYSDIAFDAQMDRALSGGASITAHGTWIRERRTLDATLADGGASELSGNLTTARFDATYYTASRVGWEMGYFATTGDTDALLYAPGSMTGSRSGSPDSKGFTARISFMPWLNTRLAVQYVAYSSFNGASKNYDGTGRNASDNNTLYLMTWLVF
jgi:hypothetical protein